ncbi:MAG TPA: GNAT family N-acetyltransferase [Vicinamibacterales bacterium]|nr:GNAT family N-acetyltransferase [Vicinamibacterales bacterium]
MREPERPLTIRRAAPGDLVALGRLGAALMRIHRAFDERRFMPPGAHPEDAYARFLEVQLADPSMLILVAERAHHGRASDILGYVYAGIEPASFKELRERAGYIHDLLIADDARGAGVGARLLEAAIAWLREQGMPRVLLWTAAQNAGARRLFEAHGFKATMVEMTREVS